MMPQPIAIATTASTEEPETMECKPKKNEALCPQAYKRLLAYAVVAGASVTGSASAAHAEIVFTPVHANIDFDYYLDLNHDGINDFHIHSSSLSGEGGVQVFPLITGNRIVATPQGCRPTGAAALQKGAIVGPRAISSSSDMHGVRG